MRDGGSRCLRRQAYRISTTIWDSNSLAAQPLLLVVALLAFFLVEMILAVWATVLLCQTVAEVQGFRSGWRALGNLFMSASLFLAAVLVLGLFFS
jgi:hypothetical protein